MLVLVTNDQVEMCFSERHWERLDPSTIWRLCFPLVIAFGPFAAPAVDKWADRPRRLCDIPIPEIVQDAWRGNLTVEPLADRPRGFLVRATPKIDKHSTVLGERGTIVELLDAFGSPAAAGSIVQHVVVWPRGESDMELGSIAVAGYHVIMAEAEAKIVAKSS